MTNYNLEWLQNFHNDDRQNLVLHYHINFFLFMGGEGEDIWT
jgi:hypothetical protein